MKNTTRTTMRSFGMAISFTAILSGCADTTGGTNRPGATQQTATERAIGKCVVAVGGGALLGALIGDSKKDALIGAGIGATACAVMLQVASREDKARLAAAEQAALRANRAATQSFTTTGGKQATVRTSVKATSVPNSLRASSKPASVRTSAKPAAKPEAAPVQAKPSVQAAAEPNYTACRYTSQTISIEGQSSATPQQLWCRVDTGDWQAVSA